MEFPIDKFFNPKSGKIGIWLKFNFFDFVFLTYLYYQFECCVKIWEKTKLDSWLYNISISLTNYEFWTEITPDEKNTAWASLTWASLMLLICFSKFWIQDNLLLPGC